MPRLLIVILVLAGMAVGAAPASAGWLAAADLAAPNALNQSVGSPVVAVARDGAAFAAFQHFDGANSRIGVVTRTPGGGFGAVRDLSDTGEDASRPALAVDRQGNATLAWLGSSGIRTRFRPAGGDWGAIQAVSATSIFSGPTIAVFDHGNAAVAWGRSTGGPRVRAEVAIRSAGSPTFGSPLFASPDAGEQLCSPTTPPRVAIDAAGDVAAIWPRRTDDGYYLIESAVKPAGASAFEPFHSQSSTTASSPCNSDIQMTPGGRVTAVWDSSEGVDPTFVAYADRSTPFASGTWSAAVKLSDPTVASEQPHLALDDNGNGAATWVAGGQLQSSVRAGLGGFTAPKPLSGTTGSFGTSQAIAASDDGDAMAAFVGMSNGNDAIFSARRRPNTDFGEVTPVVVTPPGGSEGVGGPDIALDDQGNGFAVWSHGLSTPGGFIATAQVAGYDSVAPAITGVTVPGSGTAGQPVTMSAAAADRMSGVALHFDFGDGAGADGGSVGHIYGAAGAYTVTVTATDAAGNHSSAARTIQIAAAPPPPAAGPAPSPGPQPNQPTGTLRVEATAALSYDRLSNGYTRLRALVIDRLSGPEQVRLACTGKHKGCRKAATRTIKKHGKKLDLTKYVKGMTLRPKAVLSITVSRKGYVSRIFRYTMVKRADPKKATRCLAPGAKKSVAC
jgi:hypothetical protein